MDHAVIQTALRRTVCECYHWGDDRGSGCDLVVCGPLWGQRDRVKEEGLQDVFSESDMVRTLPAQDHCCWTQRVNGQLTDTCGL